jgi:hypothetical protein
VRGRRFRLCQAYPDRVEVRGRDLAGDLMGRLSFTEYFHLLLTGDEPTEDQRYFLDLLLIAGRRSPGLDLPPLRCGKDAQTMAVLRFAP